MGFNRIAAGAGAEWIGSLELPGFELLMALPGVL